MDSSNQRSVPTTAEHTVVNTLAQDETVQNRTQDNQNVNQEEQQAQTASTSQSINAPRSASTRLTTENNSAGRADRSEKAKKSDKSLKKDKNEAVVTITAKEDFENILKTAGDKYIMVEFFATWCGPCRMLSVKLEELANLYKDKAIIVKIDVDDFEDIAIEYNVTSMPAFMIMKNKQKVEHFVGSKAEQVENALEKFVGKPT